MDYIYGNLNESIEKVTYGGSESDTTFCIVDNEKNTITVNVKPLSPTHLIADDPAVVGGDSILIAHYTPEGLLRHKWVEKHEVGQYLQDQITNNYEELNTRLIEEESARVESDTLLSQRIAQEQADRFYQDAVDRDRAIAEEQRIETESKTRDENISEALTTEVSRLDGRVDSVQATTELYKQQLTARLDVTDANLSQEIVDRETAVTTLTEQVSSTKQELQQSIGTVNTVLTEKIDADIAQEVQDRDAAISVAKDTLNKRVDNEVSMLTQNLQNEVDARTNEDDKLTTDLTQEIERAKEQETILTGKIKDEENRATAIEGSIRTDLAVEVDRAKAAEETLTTSLSSEVSRAIAAEKQLQANIDAEKARCEAETTRIENECEVSNTELRTLIALSGHKIKASVDTTDYVLTINLLDKDNNVISTDTSVNLPLETMVVNATYDEVEKKIILTLQNGTTTDVPVASLIEGLVKETTYNTDKQQLEQSIESVKQLTETAQADVDALELTVGSMYTNNEIDTKLSTVSGGASAHIENKENPHEVTKTQVGLGNVDNTSDINKPISTAQQAALDLKADKTTVETSLSNKADKTTVESISNTLNTVKGTVEGIGTLTFTGAVTDTYNPIDGSKTVTIPTIAGEPGADGKDGTDGKDGVDGVTPHIGENGNWYIGDTDTEIAAQGPQGVPGTNGSNGTTPSIVNGYWYIGTTNTGVKAEGVDGTNGTNGQDGAAAGFGTVTASISGSVGTPSVTVTTSGSNTAKNFTFEFVNLKGEKGEPGDTGEPGADGKDGTSVSILGTLTSESELPTTGTSGAAYIIDGDLYVYVGTGGNVSGHTQWSNVGQIQGPAGKDGVNGTAATVSIGTVATGAAGTSASVTNSGTSNAAILNFTIPRGEKGERGEQGPAISTTTTKIVLGNAELSVYSVAGSASEFVIKLDDGTLN